MSGGTARRGVLSLRWRLARRHNPLYRRQDALRSWLKGGLVAALLAATATCALLAYTQYHDSRTAAERAAARLRPVNAVVLGTPTAAVSGHGAGNPVAEVRWRDPDGHVVEGVTEVPPLTVQGDRVRVWLDGDDLPAPPPSSPTGSAATAICIGLCVVAGLWALLIGAHAMLRSAVERSALRAWERSWRAVEPRWSGRW